MKLLQSLVMLASLVPSIVQGVTVHLVPHSHDDVGWLKTVDQYFSGTNNDFQQASVTGLLTGVMAALKRDPNRRFSYVEQAYFQRWWRVQNDTMKDMVRGFVKNGQLEFINGGWSMHDEATTHIADMVDQTTLGHQYILKEFGEDANPTVAWQIDCFGHSATQAAVLSYQAGMDALFFGRLDYQDRAWRIANKKMQLYWQPSPSLGPDYKVWTEMALDDNYNPPDGFNFDYLVDSNGNPPIQNDPRLENYNVEDRIAAFQQQVQNYVSTRQGDPKTMNIAWWMGSDFHYMSSERNYLNMDKLIAIVNANTSLGITAQYSTPSVYFKAKMAEKQTWPVKTDDFFPLVDSPRDSWTGYFSSRPGLKGLVRMSSVLLQTARQIDVLAGGDGSGLELLWEALGVAQHHDAVTGTELQHVAYDYIKRLSVGRAAAFQVIDAGMTQLVNNGMQFTSCPLANVSICAPIAKADAFTVAVWNSEARPVSKFVQLPYYGNKAVKVRDASGKDIDSVQSRGVRTAAWTADSASNLVSFQASLPAMGYALFEVYVPSSKKQIKQQIAEAEPVAAGATFGNDFVTLTVNNGTGLIESWTDKTTGTVHKFSQNFYYYRPSEDGNFADDSAYMFSPAEGTGLFAVNKSTPDVQIVTTDLFVSLIQRWNSWLVQEVRIEMAGTGPYVDFLWTVGPVDISGDIAKEVVTRYETDINSGKTFYTDSNGLELQKRILDYRPSFNWTAIAPIASNYYPSTAIAGITDDKSALYVLTDRAHGCASLESGNLEFMVHRRTLCPCGSRENLNETDGVIYHSANNLERTGRGLIITGRHRVVLAALTPAIETARIEQQALYRPPQATFATGKSTRNERSVVSYAQSALPPNVQVQTLQVLFDGSILLRLAHSFAVNESSQYSVPVKVDLNQLFVQPLKSVTQMTLTANAKYKDRASRLVGRTESDSIENELRAQELEAVLDDTVITINPMQILTFTLTF